MPSVPIVDSHVHLWDPRVLRYPWLDHIAILNRPYLPHDFRAATASIRVDGIVFVQCEVSPERFEAEAAWIAELSSQESLIKAMLAWAPLEKGRAVENDLQALRQHSILRGIRRIIQFEPDLDFCLRPAFIDGVRTLRDFDLSFDICVDHRHMANVLKLAERVPEVSMVLDHIAKPAIREGLMHPWAEQVRELARFQNVWCKISGIATEADHEHWRADELKRYVDVAIDAFGFERVMFGSDWPVCTQAIPYSQWISLLDEILSGVAASDLQKFWRDNAAHFYRV